MHDSAMGQCTELWRPQHRTQELWGCPHRALHGVLRPSHQLSKTTAPGHTMWWREPLCEVCQACPMLTLQTGLKHPPAGTCLHHRASLNLKSKVSLCSLRAVSSDPANSQGSDRWALVASEVGSRVSQPSCFPMPGYSQAWPGNVQGQVLNPLPVTLAEHAAHDIPPWSHSRVKQHFAHKWAFSGQQCGECSGGIAQGQPPLLLVPPLNICCSSPYLCDFCSGLCVEISNRYQLAPHCSWRIKIWSRKHQWQSNITKSALCKLRAVKKDTGSAILIEQSLQYTDFNY